MGRLMADLQPYLPILRKEVLCEIKKNLVYWANEKFEKAVFFIHSM